VSIQALEPAGAFSSSAQSSPGLRARGLGARFPEAARSIDRLAPTVPGAPTDPLRPDRGEGDPFQPPRRRAAGQGGPVRSTAYQRNADGDDATFTSRADQLTEEERAEVEKLRARDREVRAHEEAHRAAAGPLFRGGPTYSFQTGPDGRKYAVGGSVQIDTSPGRTPEESVRKARRIRQAALAPAEPSSTDRAVAAKASQMEAKAQSELAREQAESSASSEAPPSRASGDSESADRESDAAALLGGAREASDEGGLARRVARPDDEAGSRIADDRSGRRDQRAERVEPIPTASVDPADSSGLTRLGERGIDLIA